MQVWKKFSAIALALVMSLALCAPAFASNTPTDPANMKDESGLIGEFNRNATENDAVKAPVIQNNKVIIYKEITAFNPSETTVSAPTITYNYKIEAGSNGKNIEDSTGIKATTFAGLVIGTGSDQKPSITSSVAWNAANNDETVKAKSVDDKGDVNRKPIEIDFTGVTFERAGVYRYKITESTNEGAKAAAGITEGTISETRYLDVYVKDNDTTPTNKDIYGYVLMEADDNVTTTTAKTEGFVATTTQTADQYHTYNLKITKKVANDNFNMKSGGHQFPFSVTFENSTVTANVRPILSKSADNASGTQPTVSAIASVNVSDLKIGHDGWVKFIGIPMGTGIKIVETNDEANTTYNVTTSGANTNIESAQTLTNGQSTANNAIAFTAQSTVNSEQDNAVTVTNTLVLISPTGVALRYAPYLAMMGAGIVALPLSLRKKEEEI